LIGEIEGLVKEVNIDEVQDVVKYYKQTKESIQFKATQNKDLDII